MFEKKQNVFDDFIAAAEWLIQNKYTNPSKLAIQGGSNGGLLMGAMMTQRPDLFGAIVCGAPLLDMLRFQKMSVGVLVDRRVRLGRRPQTVPISAEVLALSERA